jgi:hypothetical protein
MSKVSKQKALINDVVKNSTLMLVVHLCTVYAKNGQFFDRDSVNQILYWAIALAVYHYIVASIIPA